MKRSWIIAITLLIFLGCSREADDLSTNPYHDPTLFPPPDTNKLPEIPEGSFQYLYQNIFQPTCANSGCHDGNFEPDFRTLYSSYNTLVKHPVIKNNASNDFTYRVDPGNIQNSVIMERLTNDIDGISGIMPLSVDPGSDWPEKKDTYIEMIRDWIESGAPDTYGNLPEDANLKPQVIGIMAFNSGSTSNPLKRIGATTSPIGIPNSPIDVWVAFQDDQTAPADFKFTQLKSSMDLFDFKDAAEYNLQSSGPINGKDFWNNDISFTHMTTLSFPSDSVGTEFFLRTYMQDNVQKDTAEVPNNGTSEIMRSYFTLKIDSL